MAKSAESVRYIWTDQSAYEHVFIKVDDISKFAMAKPMKDAMKHMQITKRARFLLPLYTYYTYHTTQYKCTSTVTDIPYLVREIRVLQDGGE